MQPPFATSFQFRVTFDLSPATIDTRFQAVSGLSVTYQTEQVREGGENRFAHELPVRTSYEDLVLQRALVTESALVDWCRRAFENFEFSPASVSVQLLDAALDPLRTWQIEGAWPKAWSLSALNAERSELALETLTLGYRRFHTN